ncbi:hypothetical protein ACJX0J_024363, partial [Zea mays]
LYIILRCMHKYARNYNTNKLPGTTNCSGKKTCTSFYSLKRIVIYIVDKNLDLIWTEGSANPIQHMILAQKWASIC